MALDFFRACMDIKVKTCKKTGFVFIGENRENGMGTMEIEYGANSSFSLISLLGLMFTGENLNSFLQFRIYCSHHPISN